MLRHKVIKGGRHHMFNLPDKTANEFKKIFETHRVQISAMDVFYQNIRMLNNKSKILDRDSYSEYVIGILNDIELVSSPIDAFIPEETEEPDEPDTSDEEAENAEGTEAEAEEEEDDDDSIFKINRSVPEYEKIKNRMTIDFIYEILPMTHPTVMKLKENPTLLETVVDDMFIYYCLFKYLDQISKIRLMMYSNTTPIIEYVVCNIDERAIKNHIVSKNINVDKCRKNADEIFFDPDLMIMHKFYVAGHEKDNIPSFDTSNLFMRLLNNITIKSDIYIILGIYTTLSFAMSDITNEKISDSPCIVYVRDVLSKI